MWQQETQINFIVPNYSEIIEFENNEQINRDKKRI